LLCYFYFI